jgi:hypothetical protein
MRNSKISRRSGLGMPRVVFLDTFWQQTLATALAPPGECGAPAFGAHARAKTVLAFSSALGWLKGAFHNGT